jgi:hypothetical protein
MEPRLADLSPAGDLLDHGLRRKGPEVLTQAEQPTAEDRASLRPPWLLLVGVAGGIRAVKRDLRSERLVVGSTSGTTTKVKSSCSPPIRLRAFCEFTKSRSSAGASSEISSDRPEQGGSRRCSSSMTRRSRPDGPKRPSCWQRLPSRNHARSGSKNRRYAPSSGSASLRAIALPSRWAQPF